MADPLGNDEPDTPKAPKPFGVDPITGAPLYIGLDGQVYWVPTASSTTAPSGTRVNTGGSPVVAPQEVVQRSFGEEGSGGSGGITPAQQATIEQNKLNFTEGVREFDLTRGDRIDAANAQLTQEATLATQAAAARLDEVNANLAADRATLEIRLKELASSEAAADQQMRFLIRKEQVAVETNNRTAKLEAQSFIHRVNTDIANQKFQRQELVTQVNGINAQIQNNTDQFNSQEEARVEQLNEVRRQNNLSETRENAELIGTLAADPSDIGKTAAFLRSGGGGALGALSQRVAQGRDFITDESLVPLAGALGVQSELLKGPTVATPNLVDANLVDVPQFQNDLGAAPGIEELFRNIGFDTSNLERESTPPTDLSQFFNDLGASGNVTAQQVTSGAPAGASPSGEAPAGAPQPTPADTSRVVDLTNRGVLPEGTTPGGMGQNRLDKVGDVITEQQMRDFFARLNPMEHGGMAPPGMPVMVGDSSDGKENEELAMVDEQGNLVVIPMDQLPKAETGGMFSSVSRPGVAPTPSKVPFDFGPAFGFGGTPGAQQGRPPIASLEDTRSFLDDSQRETLRRGGFTDPTQISPIKVSAPGTPDFLKKLSGSAFGALGFGSRELFFEELMKLIPKGVQGGGVTRRTN